MVPTSALTNRDSPSPQPPGEDVQRFILALDQCEITDSIAPAVTRHLLGLFAMPGVKYQALGRLAMSLIRLNPSVHAWIESYRSGSNPTCASDLLHELNTPLVHVLLRKTIVRNHEFEVLLTAARRALFSAAISAEKDQRPPIELAVSIGCQCFATEYLYATEPPESQQVEHLDSKLTRWLAGDFSAIEDPELLIAVCGMYRPLWTLDPNRRLLQLSTEGWAKALEPLISAQVADHWEEAEIMTQIPALGLSQDGVSQVVRQQYERAPYPKWLSIWTRHPRPLAEVLKSYFPLLTNEPDGNDPTDLLVAGCGTGSHPLTEATRYKNVRVVAVDLSRPSLAYGIRMARRYGIKNVEFVQSDILSLDDFSRRFDLIDVYGVLHHMADPERGLAALVRLLKPGGHIWLGVYNREARRLNRMVRHLLQERGIQTEDELKAAREEALRSPDASDPLKSLTEVFTVSELRDDFLHAHELDFTLTEIAVTAHKAGLRLVGVSDLRADVQAAFWERFPNQASLNDLELLRLFDRDYPNPVRTMYEVLAQKMPTPTP